MSILSTISEALCLYGKSINRNAVVRVTFEFKNTPTDLPGCFPTWEVIVKLLGNTSGDCENVETLFTQEFKGEASSEAEAIQQAFDQIKERVQSFLASREEETQFAQQAAMLVSSGDQADLSDLWVKGSPSVGEQPEGT